MFDFLLKESCSHSKIFPDVKSAYCPDCGEFIENFWYISRCKCCSTKQKTIVINGKVKSTSKFCKNCGCSDFITEELKEIDVININYAAVIKKSRKIKKTNFIQTWIDDCSYSPVNLLPCY